MDTRKQQLLRRHRRGKRLFMVAALLVLVALDWFAGWNSRPVFLVLAWIAHEAISLRIASLSQVARLLQRDESSLRETVQRYFSG